MSGSTCETWTRICDDWIGISWYSSGPIFTVNSRLTASDYVDIVCNQVHPMVQMLLPYIAAVFQDDNLPVHTARSVQSLLEEHEDTLQHLPWPVQSSDLNTIEQVLVSFREQGEKQTPSSINSQATIRCSSRRAAQYCTGDCSELI